MAKFPFHFFFLMCVLSHDRYPFLPTSSSMKIRRPRRLTLFQVANNFNGIWKKKMSLYFLLKNTQIEESMLSDTTDWTKACLTVRANQPLLNNHEQKKKKAVLRLEFMNLILPLYWLPEINSAHFYKTSSLRRSCPKLPHCPQTLNSVVPCTFAITDWVHMKKINGDSDTLLSTGGICSTSIRLKQHVM